MKTKLLLFIGTLLLASCQTEDLEPQQVIDQNEEVALSNVLKSFNNYTPMGNMPQASKNVNANQVTKDIIFRYSRGTFGVVVNPEACGDFFDPPLQFVIEGDGIATHIGRFTVENFACVNPQGEILSNMYGFITSANGDVIHTVVVNSYPDEDNPPNVYYEYMIIGGSPGGRFEVASGSITMYGIIDYATGTFELEGWGEITY
ncbi:MAG: hypothetical protein ABF293_09390 [Flavobacteriaceae bacterium]